MTTNDNTGRERRGFVPGLDADPVTARYETMRPEQAVDRVAAVGFTRADAQTMVSEYLADQTARHGEPAGGWQVDQYDLAEIARRYEWVDHYRGETIAAARERAVEYAAGWTDRAAQIDPDRDPHIAARAARQIERWTDRATPPQQQAGTGDEPATEGLDPAAPEFDDPGREREGPPTVGEIAALTARLRDLTRPGAPADPAVREAFLADKQALLNRILRHDTTTDTDTDDAGETGRELHRHIARTAAPDERPADDGVEAWPPIPDWTRDQARHAEAGLADASTLPARSEDRAELAARVAALREQTAHDPDARSEVQRYIRPGQELHPDQVEEQEARREQLARWHTDDTTPTTDTDSDSDSEEAIDWDTLGTGAGAGERYLVTDDGPGLP